MYDTIKNIKGKVQLDQGTPVAKAILVSNAWVVESHLHPFFYLQ